MDTQERLSAYARQRKVQVYPSQYGKLAWVPTGRDGTALPVALWNVPQWGTPAQRKRAYKKARSRRARMPVSVLENRYPWYPFPTTNREDYL